MFVCLSHMFKGLLVCLSHIFKGLSIWICLNFECMFEFVWTLKVYLNLFESLFVCLGHMFQGRCIWICLNFESLFETLVYLKVSLSMWVICLKVCLSKFVWFLKFVYLNHMFMCHMCVHCVFTLYLNLFVYG